MGYYLLCCYLKTGFSYVLSLTLKEYIGLFFRTIIRGVVYGFQIFRPSFLQECKRRLFAKLSTMTTGQLLITSGKYCFRSIYWFLYTGYFVTITICRFMLYMMGGRKHEDAEPAPLSMPEPPKIHHEIRPPPIFNEFLQPETVHIEAFGIQIAAEDVDPDEKIFNTQQSEMKQENLPESFVAATAPESPPLSPVSTSAQSPTLGGQLNKPSRYKGRTLQISFMIMFDLYVQRVRS